MSSGITRIINNKPNISKNWRGIGWIACLFLTLGLAISSWKAAGETIRQAKGVQGLLQAGASLSKEEINNPTVCFRGAGDGSLARESLKLLNDKYLQGVALCIIGETKGGLEAFKMAGGHSNADVQYAKGVSAYEPQVGAEALAGAELSDEKLIAEVTQLLKQEGVDPYPALRMLAKEANSQPETWNLWIQGSSRLEKENKWKVALDWMNEGLSLAPEEYRSSLYQRTGWIWQTRNDKPDLETALEFYNIAIEKDAWISVRDEAIAHDHRGQVYRTLPNEYNSNLAIEEFNIALTLLPEDYWILLDIGFTYLNNIKDLDQADRYFKQALAENNQLPNAFVYIGDVSKARGDNHTAIEWYQKALEKQPDFQPALNRLAALEGK